MESLVEGECNRSTVLRGMGKTHMVQNIDLAVEFIWPPVSKAEPTLAVVASSNAQAKNISTTNVKARTLHSASGMVSYRHLTCVLVSMC